MTVNNSDRGPGHVARLEMTQQALTPRLPLALVLDIDGTLIDSSDCGTVIHKRPGVDAFLDDASVASVATARRRSKALPTVKRKAAGRKPKGRAARLASQRRSQSLPSLDRPRRPSKSAPRGGISIARPKTPF